jgi:hypothetical protein
MFSVKVKKKVKTTNNMDIYLLLLTQLCFLGTFLSHTALYGYL